MNNEAIDVISNEEVTESITEDTVEASTSIEADEIPQNEAINEPSPETPVYFNRPAKKSKNRTLANKGHLAKKKSKNRNKEKIAKASKKRNRKWMI